MHICLAYFNAAFKERWHSSIFNVSGIEKQIFFIDPSASSHNFSLVQNNFERIGVCLFVVVVFFPFFFFFHASKSPDVWGKGRFGVGDLIVVVVPRWIRAAVVLLGRI